MRKEKVKNNHHKAQVVGVPELPDIQINGFNWYPERKYQAPRRNLFPKGSSSLNKRCPGWRPNSWRFSSRWSNRTGSFRLRSASVSKTVPFACPLQIEWVTFANPEKNKIKTQKIMTRFYSELHLEVPCLGCRIWKDVKKVSRSRIFWHLGKVAGAECRLAWVLTLNAMI